MIKSDYLLRIIRQFSEFLALVLVKKKQQQPEEVRQVLQEASRKLLGMDAGVLETMPAHEITRLFSLDPNAAPEKLKMCARLLQELAAFNPGGTEGVRAFILYMEAYARDASVLDDEYRVLAGALVPAVLAWGDDAETLLAMLRYHEMRGDYGRAEDLLYDLKDVDPDTAGAEGFAFYRRLAGLDDTVLVKGNLPRDEVEEGLRAFR